MALHFGPGLATFIHIPKCAGTSVVGWTKSLRPINTNKHAKWPKVKAHWPSHGQVFTLVRNPYSRAISLYHYLGQLATGKISSPRQYAPYARWKELYAQTFKHFLIALAANDPSVDVTDTNWHVWDTQWSWIADAPDPLIIRIEELDQNLPTLKNMLALDGDLPTVNVSEHAFYKDYYDHETRALVEQIWAEDFHKLNYSW